MAPPVRVEFQEDGSMQFRGTVRVVDLDVARRQVIDTLGVVTKFLSFAEIHQVVLAGPPGEKLRLQLTLKRGEALELGLIEDAEFGVRLGARIAKLLGCGFGGVVRLPTLRVRMDETEETQAFARTVQIQACDVVDEVSDCTSVHTMPEGAPTQEVPAFGRSAPGLLSLFDEAARDLLARSPS